MSLKKLIDDVTLSDKRVNALFLTARTWEGHSLYPSLTTKQQSTENSTDCNLARKEITAL